MHVNPETLIHVFFECPDLCNFWNHVTDYISLQFNIDIHMINNLHTLAFGINFLCPQKNVVNCFLTCARFIVYRGKIRGTVPSIFELLYFIKITRNVEKQIALKNNKLPFHTKKWRDLPNI